MILVLIYSKIPKKINYFEKSLSNIVKIHYCTHFKNIYNIIVTLFNHHNKSIHQAGIKS